MTEYEAGARERAPTHPGKILRRALGEFTKPMSVRAAALAIRVKPQAIANVIEGKSAVSPEMALRLGTFFGSGAELWIGLQLDHDLWQARQKMKGELAKIAPAATASQD